MKKKTTKIISSVLVIALVAGSVSLVAIKGLGGKRADGYINDVNNGNGQVQDYKKILGTDDVTKENLKIVNKAIKEAKNKSKKNLTSEEIKLEAKKAIENNNIKEVIKESDKKEENNIEKCNINGKVNCGDASVKNATIIVKKDNTGIGSGQTSDIGEFTVKDIEVGECMVEAKAEGYKVMNPIKVNVKKGMESINISLEKAEALKENEIEGVFKDGLAGGIITVKIPEKATVDKVMVNDKQGNPDNFDYAIKENNLLVYAKVAATKVVVTINGVEKTVVVK